MNDIYLRHTSDREKWDWDFGLDDVNVVHGKYQTLNAVKHAILLRRGELTQAIYHERGSTVHDYAKMANNELQHDLVQAAIESTAKEVDGVAEAMVKVTDSHPYQNQATLHLITDEMEEITLKEVELI